MLVKSFCNAIHKLCRSTSQANVRGCTRNLASKFELGRHIAKKNIQTALRETIKICFIFYMIRHNCLI